jgi:hypothetical protein
MMNKTVIGMVAILALASVLGYYLYLQHTRYEISASDKGVAYVVDRKSGQTWMLAGARKIAHDEPQRTERLADLPNSEVAKVTGNAGFSHGFFKGTLYNGSGWRVREVTFQVSGQEKDETTRWTREYREAVHIDPFTSKEFIFHVTGEEGAKAKWGIIGARGTQQQ